MNKGLWLSGRFVNFSELQQGMGGEVATRKRRWEFSYMGMLPNPDPILKRQGRDIDVYKDLQSDAHISACIQSRKAGVTALNWEINRGGDKDKAASAIDDMFHKLKVERILEEILEASLFGYQPMEIMWRIEDGLLVPYDLVGKPAEWFCFDDENRLRFRTAEKPLLGEVVPDNKFLIGTHGASYSNPYGLGELSRCFWPAAFKRGGWKFWSIFGEKYGMPWLMAKYPPGTEDKVKDQLLDSMERAVQDAILVMPDNCSVELKESGSKGGSADVYERLIARADAEFSKTLVGQTLTTEVGSSGSYAAAQTHFKVRADIVTADAKMAAAIFNQLIDLICLFNFPEAKRPTLTLYAPEDVDKELAERDEILSRIGVRFSRKYLKENYNLAEDDIDAIMPPAASGQQQGQAFAEESPTPANDGVAEAMDAAGTITPAELQQQAEGLLKPVIALIRSGATREAILEKLAGTWPQMDDHALETMLARAMFVSELLARTGQGA